MTIAFFLDHNVPRAIADGLRLRKIDVITAWEDGSNELDDSSLLDRATDLDRVLFTHDDDLLLEAAERQVKGLKFSGVIFAHQLKVSIGLCIRDLELIANLSEPEDLSSRVEFLPI